MVRFPVSAQSVDVTALSIPPLIPITNPSVFDFEEESLSQLTICSVIFLLFRHKQKIPNESRPFVAEGRGFEPHSSREEPKGYQALVAPRNFTLRTSALGSIAQFLAKINNPRRSEDHLLIPL